MRKRTSKPERDPAVTVQRRVKHRQELEGIKRVLTLVDGYLSTRPQSYLIGWNGGLMTWGEIRKHIQAALKTKVLNDQAPALRRLTQKYESGKRRSKPERAPGVVMQRVVRRLATNSHSTKRPDQSPPMVC